MKQSLAYLTIVRHQNLRPAQLAQVAQRLVEARCSMEQVLPMLGSSAKNIFHASVECQIRRLKRMHREVEWDFRDMCVRCYQCDLEDVPRLETPEACRKAAEWAARMDQGRNTNLGEWLANKFSTGETA